MDEVTLREYRRGDWEAMYMLDLECFEPAFRFSRRAMRGFAEASGALTILAEANGDLVGFCVVRIEEQTCYVVTLDVASGWRRRGLARRLMAEVETRARVAGAASMLLHVFLGNTDAVGFYEANGYAPVGIVKGFYGYGLDALVYQKRFYS